ARAGSCWARFAAPALPAAARRRPLPTGGILAVRPRPETQSRVGLLAGDDAPPTTPADGDGPRRHAPRRLRGSPARHRAAVALAAGALSRRRRRDEPADRRPRDRAPRRRRRARRHAALEPARTALPPRPPTGPRDGRAAHPLRRLRPRSPLGTAGAARARGGAPGRPPVPHAHPRAHREGPSLASRAPLPRPGGRGPGARPAA